MKYSITLTAVVAGALAYPSMDEFKAEAARRSLLNTRAGGDLWGDLAQGGATSKTGEAIMSIMSGGASGLSQDGYDAPKMDSEECQKDECCVWKYMAEEMMGMMTGSNGCNDYARGSIRLGFHDAGAWDLSSGPGGADASIILSGSELGRAENSGLAGHASRTQGLHAKYEKTFKGISLADTIQLSAKVAVQACKGPRIRMFVGRPDNSKAAPQGRLPSAILSAADSMDLFAQKSISPDMLVALIGAHTCSNSHGSQVVPQDNTPAVWDTNYFKEALRPSASNGIGRFLADVNLAHDDTTGPIFERFSQDIGSWDAAYASAYIRMSLFGVMKMNDLKECTIAMPRPGNKNGNKNDEKPTSSSTSSKGEPTSTKGGKKDHTSTEATTTPTTKAKVPASTYTATSTAYEEAKPTPYTPSPPKDQDKPAPVVDSSDASRLASGLLAVAAAFALL